MASVVEALRQLAGKNKDFERFVVRHVDETIPVETRRQIVKNTQTMCPAITRRLCSLIENAAKED